MEPITNELLGVYRRLSKALARGDAATAAAEVRAGSLDPDAVVTQLEQTDIMGVYGRLRFDPKSHQVIPASDPKEGAVGSILQWQDGQRVVVFPKSIAKGSIQLPPWMEQ